MPRSLSSSIIESLEKITGYKKSRLYDFRIAGEKLLEWDSKEPLPLKITEFLRPKSKSTYAIIKNIKEIGYYEAYGRRFGIYSGEMKATNEKLRIIYFKTTDELSAEIIEINTLQEPNTNIKTEGKIFYTCDGKTVDLHDFEPRKGYPINIKAER